MQTLIILSVLWPIRVHISQSYRRIHILFAIIILAGLILFVLEYFGTIFIKWILKESSAHNDNMNKIIVDIDFDVHI